MYVTSSLQIKITRNAMEEEGILAVDLAWIDCLTRAVNNRATTTASENVVMKHSK
jgi:hypothetical protein